MDVAHARATRESYARELDTLDLDDPRVVRDEVAKHGWWHEIDLGNGVVTPALRGGGASGMLEALRLPDLTGKTVLDVGAWDGALSFLAERSGAQVTAFDLARPPTFELASRVLRSKVRYVEGDITTIDPASLGTFDVVLCLGVIYHVPSPFDVLERLAPLARDLLVIETDTAANTNPNPMARFVLDTDAYLDGASRYRPNFWLPNSACCHAMLRACGFREVEQVHGPSAPRGTVERLRRIALAAARRQESGYGGRAVFHARRGPASRAT